MHHRYVLVAGLLVAGVVMPGTGNTAAQLQTAVNNCQGALPSFEGKLRKRPLGMANEGTTTAFLTCALSAVEGHGHMAVGARFTNRGTVPAAINCTMIDNSVYWEYDLPGYPMPIYYTKTVVFAAGESGLIEWNSVSEELPPYHNNVNLSCALPPGVELNFNYRHPLGTAE